MKHAVRSTLYHMTSTAENPHYSYGSIFSYKYLQLKAENTKTVFNHRVTFDKDTINTLKSIYDFLSPLMKVFYLFEKLASNLETPVKCEPGTNFERRRNHGRLFKTGKK